MPSSTLNIEQLTEVGRQTIWLASGLTENKKRENWIHGVVLGLLQAYVGDMQSEVRVGDGLKRIDFRHGGSNPDFIELVVRYHGVETGRTQIESELQKLCRIPYAKARRRYLLILDFWGNRPMSEARMEERYNEFGAGPGNFGRNSVRVVYVHPEESFDFLWQP